MLDCANSGRPTLLLLLPLLLLLLLRMLTPVPVCGYRKRFAVLVQHPQNANGQLRNDQEFCTKLQGELKKTVFGMCTMNPTKASKPSHIDTNVDLIFKRFFFATICS